MDFEWDNQKNEINKEKHGISFDEAINVFNDNDVYIEKTNRTDEPRFKIVGLIFDKLYTLIFTIRQNMTRIISARRANKQEEKKYNENKS
jgi:uncharacterized protein